MKSFTALELAVMEGGHELVPSKPVSKSMMLEFIDYISAPMITEGARIEHPEDLVFTEGSAGALRAIAGLEYLVQNPDSTLSVKWDGSPAIIFGRRIADGKFTMNYKEWIGKPGGQVTTPQELAQFIRSRGGDKEGLIQKLVAAWPVIEAAVPPNFSGLIWGDLMFVGTPPIVKGSYVFKPNTVTYSIKANSPLGKQVAKSTVGVAVHQYLADVGEVSQPLKGTGGLQQSGQLLVLTGDMAVPHVKLNVTAVKQAKAWINAHKAEIDEFFNPANLLGMRGINLLMKKYINSRVRSGDMTGLTDGWLAWIPNNAGSAAQGAKMLEYSRTNEKGLIGVFGSVVLITQLKENIKQQLDTAQAASPVQANPGHEGYVTGAGDDKLKLVDRLQFSRLNFANTR